MMVMNKQCDADARGRGNSHADPDGFAVTVAVTAGVAGTR
jgi:hypothetical protein